MKTFFNGKKVLVISPLLIDNTPVSAVKAKANHFSDFFASKCTPLVNNSSIPESIAYSSEARLSQITFSDNDILKITRIPRTASVCFLCSKH